MHLIRRRFRPDKAGMAAVHAALAGEIADALDDPSLPTAGWKTARRLTSAG